MTPKAAFAGVWSICLEEFVPLLGVEARTQHVEGAGGGNERGSGGLSRDIGRPPGSESEWAHVSASYVRWMNLRARRGRWAGSCGAISRTTEANERKSMRFARGNWVEVAEALPASSCAQIPRTPAGNRWIRSWAAIREATPATSWDQAREQL